MTEKVWFITGTSRGFGREWAIAALERGDQVAATTRNTATLADLVDKYGDAVLPIQLDVTDRAADFAAVKQAHDHFGRLDIVVNNAGYGQFGFGIHVTLIEPAGFDTDWAGSSSRRAEELPAYAEIHAATEAVRRQRWAAPGNPKASAAALLKVVDAQEPPLRVFFGEAPLGLAKADYENRLRTWEQWQPVAELAQG